MCSRKSIVIDLMHDVTVINTMERGYRIEGWEDEESVSLTPYIYEDENGPKVGRDELKGDVDTNLCRNTTPLGCAVVPLVYKMVAVS